MTIMIPYSNELSERSRAKLAAFNPNAGTLYSIKETAALLEVSTRTVARWIDAGTLKAFQIGGRWRVPAGEIARLLHMEQEGGADENE